MAATMTLWMDMAAKCRLMRLEERPDGQGGCKRSLVAGDAFAAAITGKGQEAQDAGARRLGGTFMVTSERELAYGDIVQGADGAVYRVCSKAERAPGTLGFWQCAAQAWEAMRDEQA